MMNGHSRWKTALAGLSSSIRHRCFAYSVRITLVLAACLLLLSSHYYINTNDRSLKWKPFLLPIGSHCLNTTVANITIMPELIKKLHHCRRKSDLDALIAFKRIYSVSQRTAGMYIPEQFRPKVLNWLGGKAELYDQTLKQTVTSIFNLISNENTLFNPLRARRPGANDGDDSLNYVRNLTLKNARNCDFCKVESLTAADIFPGQRILGKFSKTASNVFKYDAWHGLIILNEHDPLMIGQEAFMDMMQTALQWFERAHAVDPDSRFPHLMWDLLPKASASQIHPHAQVSLSPDRYYGLMESIKNAATAMAIAYLTPKKEWEVSVYAETANQDFFMLLYHVLRVYREDLSVLAWSMAIFFPEMGNVEGKATIPAYARVIDRGLPTSSRSDISAMELFAASNVNAEPFTVIKKLKQGLSRTLDIVEEDLF